MKKKIQIKYIYDIGEQTNELRAKLLTVENDVKLNSASVEKTRKYTELVHGAWQEALQLRQSLKVSSWCKYRYLIIEMISQKSLYRL